jgi:hypothetical protein
MKRISTKELRQLDPQAIDAIDQRIIDVGGADGSLYRAELRNDSWIVVTSAGGGTTWKVGTFDDLETALAEIRAIADDREVGS